MSDINYLFSKYALGINYAKKIIKAVDIKNGEEFWKDACRFDCTI